MTYPVSVHEADLYGSIGKEIVGADVLALCKARIKDDIIEWLLHGLSADLVGLHGESVGLD